VDSYRIPAVFPNWLEDAGLSPAGVLERAGLPAKLFSEASVVIGLAQFVAMWKAIGELSPDPAVGLKIGSNPRHERYDPIVIAALNAPSFGVALQRLARYKRLTCPEQIMLAPEQGDYLVRFDWPWPGHAAPSAFLDNAFALAVSLGRRGTADAINPRRVEFRRDKLELGPYTAFYRCEVRLGAERDALIYDTDVAAHPFEIYNPEVFRLLGPGLEQELTLQAARQTLIDRVKSVLKKLLAGQRPNIRQVARELKMSPRTLQRRLAEDGVTFQQLLSESRRELAVHYLRESQLGLGEVSYLLGYEDSNSFFRAFQNWEGMSPGQWRAGQTPGNAPA
jgi:AraC-like DNA-binding protein